MGRTNASGKPKGRMTAYAFFMQTYREEHKRMHPQEPVVFIEFSRNCSAKWKVMSEKEKQRFGDMANRDKDRYDREMSTYVPPKGEQQAGKKKNKDPNAPKRGLSAFFHFSNEERSKVKAANSSLSIGEIARELGKRWALIQGAARAKYDAAAARDKARYEQEMQVYRSQSGLPQKKVPGGGGGAAPPPPAANKEESEDDSEEDDDDEDDDDDDDDEEEDDE